MIARASIDALVDRVAIEDVVGLFVGLKKRGHNLLGLCPFHNERTPSFTVSPHKGFYKCFGCGKAGNSIGFIMEHEKMDFPEAVRFLAARFNIELEETQATPEEAARTDERESLLVANRFAAEFFAGHLQSATGGASEGAAYFKERGIKPESITTWALGYAPPGRTNLLDAARKNAFHDDILLKAGLVGQPEDGPIYDRFRGRAMFPIQSATGKVIAFGGRVLGAGRDKEPKYLNSPETDVYHKSDVLYGLFQARKAIRERDQCIVTEGYMDVISLHQAGITNAVGSSGTAFTEGHVGMIRRLTENITLLYDRDAAGEKATLRAIELALAGGLNAYVVVLPDGEDPDSFAQKNSDSAIAAFLKNERQDFYQYVRNQLSLGADDPLALAAGVGTLLNYVALIPDPLKRGFYAQRITQDYALEEQTVIAELNRRILSQRDKRYLQNRESIQDGQQSQYEGNYTPIATVTEQGRPSAHNDFEQERDVVRTLVFYANLPLGDKSQENENVLVGDALLEVCNDSAFINDTFTELLTIYKAQKVASKVFPEAVDLIKSDNTTVSAAVIDLGLSIDETRLSENWQLMHAIAVPLPTEVYQQDVFSSVNRFQMVKLNRMLDENLEQLKTAHTDEEINDILVVQKYLLETRSTLAKKVGSDVVR